MRGYQQGYIATILLLVLMFLGSLVYLSVNIERAALASSANQPLAQTVEATDGATETAQPIQQTTQTQVPVSTPLPAVTVAPEPAVATATPAQELPYSLTQNGVASDVATLGDSMSALSAEGIYVMAHNGRIPKRCSSGSSSTTSTSGLAIKPTSLYPACPDGGQPIYDAYKPAGYRCVVIYNNQSGKKLAILAHELAHCKHFVHGQYRAFDIDYKQIRPVSGLSAGQMNEIIADDIMICTYGRDTSWGSSSYYARYGVSSPTNTDCDAINKLVRQYL